MDDYVRYELASGVATITLDSPHNRNALSVRLMSQLAGALHRAIDDADVRVIVLTHTGRVFCSGADLKPTDESTTGGSLAAGLPDLLTAIWLAPKPVVARVAGPARAGGLGLIAAADIAVASDAATFAFTEVRIGVVPAIISATVLARLAPRAAAELYLTGDVFDGRRAAAIGLVTAAVPADELDAAVAAYVDSLRRAAPGALAATKELLRRDTDLPADLAGLAPISERFFNSAEGQEGIAAFRERRPPHWVPADLA